MDMMEVAAYGVVAFGVAKVLGPLLAGLKDLVTEVLKTIFTFIRGLFFVQKALHDGFASRVLTDYLEKKAKGVNLLDEYYWAKRIYLKPKGSEGVVFLRSVTASFRLYFYRGAPILLNPNSGVEESRGGNPSIWYLRGTVNWERLVIDAAAFWDDMKSTDHTRRFRVIYKTGSARDSSDLERLSNALKGSDPPVATAKEDNDGHAPVGWLQEDLGAPVPESPMNHLSIGQKVQEIIRDSKFWYSHRDWYKERGIPWRRGYMLYGKPGTGKTSLVRAIAEDLDMPVFVFDLQSMSNHEFITAWNSARQHSPRIVLLEDIDAVFHGRENVNSQGGGLTFDAMLNAIDGIEREDGLMLCITTNCIDKVDPALGIPGPDGVSTRPGRIDVTLEIPNMDYAGRLKMARRIVQDEEIAVELATKHTTYTPAQFQEVCVKEALEILWGDKYKEVVNAG